MLIQLRACNLAVTEIKYKEKCILMATFEELGTQDPRSSQKVVFALRARRKMGGVGGEGEGRCIYVIFPLNVPRHKKLKRELLHRI